MEAIPIGSDPRFYFQVGKMKISEGMKCLQDLVHWCKDNSSPENGGILHEIKAYLQYLQRQIQEIESGAPQGGEHGSFDLQRGQEVTQVREQNANFELIPNQEIDMVMNKKEIKPSCSKRKTRSDVWEHFTKYENKDRKTRAVCEHCKKDFDGSSKSGTTHLRNHIKSCLKNPNRVGHKAKEMVVVDGESNNSILVQKLIKYGLNGIREDIFEVYKQEKNKVHRYLEETPGCFNMSIARPGWLYGACVIIWFINDNWERKEWILHSGINNIFSDERSNEHFLTHLLQDWNIDTRIWSTDNLHNCLSKDAEIQFTNWLSKRAPHRFIGNCETHNFFLRTLLLKEISVLWESDIMIKVGKLKDYYMAPLNKYKFEFALGKIESMGKKVTSNYTRVDFLEKSDLLDWAMSCEEVFRVLEDIDPDFKSINFDWKDATFLHNICTVLEDLNEHFRELMNSIFTLANECFPVVYRSFLKMLQLKNTECKYFWLVALVWREIFDKYWNNCELLIVIAVILDPRYKGDMVEHFYKEIYGDLPFGKIMGDVTNVYNEYAKDVNNSSLPQHANEVASSKSEFDSYLTDPKVLPCEEFDILKWWQFNSATYPTLAIMARNILSIPIFRAVDGNILCSLADDINDTYERNKLDVDLVCALVCIKSWRKELESM